MQKIYLYIYYIKVIFVHIPQTYFFFRKVWMFEYKGFLKCVKEKIVPKIYVIDVYNVMLNIRVNEV